MEEYSGIERRLSEDRVGRIENAVIKLEKDMAVMTKAITDMTSSVKTLADMRLETQLLKQDYEHQKKECDKVVGEIKQEFISFKSELKELKENTSKNTWAREITSKAGWLLIGGGVSFIFYMIQTYG